MSNPYPPRFRASCADCGWYTQTYDRHVADGAVRVHGHLKPEHVTVVSPIEPTHQPSERLRCGEPHPHYSSMSCGREPGHDDAHSYGVARTQPKDGES